jgi:hypothetical protein
MNGLDSYARCLAFPSFQLSHIESKKDTYDILLNTIASNLNEMMQYFIASPGIEFKHDPKTGKNTVRMLTIVEELHRLFHVVKLTSPTRTCPSDYNNLCPQVNNAAPRVRRVKTHLVMTGDLKFQSMMQGKVNMDGKWCPVCDANPRRDYSGFLTREGDKMWTRSSMEDHQHLNHNRPDLRKGIVSDNLIPIEPTDIIFPVLHALALLIGPEVNDHLMKIVDHYVENLPEVRAARCEYEDIKYPGEGRTPSAANVAKAKKTYSKLLKNVTYEERKV